MQLRVSCLRASGFVIAEQAKAADALVDEPMIAHSREEVVQSRKMLRLEPRREGRYRARVVNVGVLVPGLLSGRSLAAGLGLTPGHWAHAERSPRAIVVV